MRKSGFGVESPPMFRQIPEASALAISLQITLVSLLLVGVPPATTAMLSEGEGYITLPLKHNPMINVTN
ncbi:uncharacterized protein V1513DRAFT_462660 [Lipomyces chichibuensis]|uniref:uncharacterized protein n=1 Tax=Lipomyces chichibuensis TaxID=1546026 RepID=UPI003343DCB9